MNNAFASTPPAHPALRTPPSPATLSALLLNPSKNRLFLQCSNTVTIPAKALNWLLCIPWTLITLLKGLSTDQGVISNSLEGWYDLMMTYGGMLITISSSEGRIGGRDTCLQLERTDGTFDSASCSLCCLLTGASLLLQPEKSLLTQGFRN